MESQYGKSILCNPNGGAIFRLNNLLIIKEIDTQPPIAHGKLITLCNEL